MIGAILLSLPAPAGVPARVQVCDGVARIGIGLAGASVDTIDAIEQPAESGGTRAARGR